jgi:pimeloyl-ACP methyl ester carboxylesterase
VTERGEFAALDAVPPGWNAAPDRSAALLLPGWTGSKEDFLAVLAGLAEAGHRVVAVDQRGQYETAGPADPAAYTLEALGADAIGLAAALDAATVHLVGHSFGGLVARSAVLAAPDAFGSLTLMSSGPASIPGEDQRKLLELMAEAIPGFGLARTHDSKRELERASGFEDPPPDIEEFLRTRFCANAPASLVAITRHLIDTKDRVDELAMVAIPKLVMYGEQDDSWPPRSQDEMALRLDARREPIADCGHSPAVEQPGRIVEILRDFWAA